MRDHTDIILRLIVVLVEEAREQTNADDRLATLERIRDEVNSAIYHTEKRVVWTNAPIHR